jgi:hypothetical protein
MWWSVSRMRCAVVLARPECPGRATGTTRWRPPATAESERDVFAWLGSWVLERNEADAECGGEASRLRLLPDTDSPRRDWPSIEELKDMSPPTTA